MLGVALMHTVRQGKEGERLLDRAVQLAPHDADVAYARALSLEHRSILRWDKAHEAVGRALELAPHDPRVRLLKAKVDLGRVGWLDDSGRAAVAEDLRGILAADPGNVEAAYLLARCEVKPDRVEVEDLHRVVRMDPLHGEAIAKVDAVLVGPVRQAYWVLWSLVALQAVLLRRGADWGAALKVLLFVFVLLVPLVRFRLLRRGSPPGFGRLGGRDPLLWLCAALVVVAAFVFKAGTDGIAPATSQWVCVALLLFGGAVYVVRRVRRRRRYG